MKTVSLYIKNIGLIAEELINLNKPLILFFGDIRQGKTTILNAVRYVFGGAFPTDLLRHGEAEGEICLTFEGAYIRRTFYRGDDGTVKARPLEYFIGEERVLKPVDALKKLINPFLLDQDHLIRMSELERKKYFVELFNANTADLDKDLKDSEAKASEARAELRGFGTIDLTEHVMPNVAASQAKLDEVRRVNKVNQDSHEAEVSRVRDHNLNYDEAKAAYGRWVDEIERLKKLIAEAEVQKAKISEWIVSNPAQAIPACPVPMSTAELEAEISNAKAQEVLAKQYQKNKETAARRDALAAGLSSVEAHIREVRRLKVVALAKINESTGIPGLVFDEAGGFTFEDTQAGMLSTSQMMKLSSQLSALYPKDLGLDLIDRAESLGKSIFTYSDRAKAEQKTILATIVGERPAVVPEDIGVFVVEGGKIS